MDSPNLANLLQLPSSTPQKMSRFLVGDDLGNIKTLHYSTNATEESKIRTKTIYKHDASLGAASVQQLASSSQGNGHTTVCVYFNSGQVRFAQLVATRKACCSVFKRILFRVYGERGWRPWSSLGVERILWCQWQIYWAFVDRKVGHRLHSLNFGS